MRGVEILSLVGISPDVSQEDGIKYCPKEWWSCPTSLHAGSSKKLSGSGLVSQVPGSSFRGYSNGSQVVQNISHILSQFFLWMCVCMCSHVFLPHSQHDQLSLRKIWTVKRKTLGVASERCKTRYSTLAVVEGSAFGEICFFGLTCNISTGIIVCINIRRSSGWMSLLSGHPSHPQTLPLKHWGEVWNCIFMCNTENVLRRPPTLCKMISNDIQPVSTLFQGSWFK